MKYMKKIIIIVIIIIIISLGVFIKFVYNKPPVEPKMQKVTVMMPFISQVQWAAYYTAKHKGYYEDEGLDVEIQYSTKGGSGPIEQLIGGNVDFILANEDSVIMARSKDLDIIAVYPIEPTNVFYIISEKDKNINKPGDLVGKKVGVISSASGGYTNLLAILHLSNIKIAEVEIVQAGTSVVPAFLEGKFDAAAIHLSQKLLIEEEIPNLNTINAFDYTNVSSGHIVVTKNLIENNPELIKKFLSATKKGLEYTVNNPEEAVEIYIRLNPDAESTRKVSQDLWNAFIENYHYKAGIPEFELPQDWQKSQDLLYNIGMITKKTNISEMYTNEFVPK